MELLLGGILQGSLTSSDQLECSLRAFPLCIVQSPPVMTAHTSRNGFSAVCQKQSRVIPTDQQVATGPSLVAQQHCGSVSPMLRCLFPCMSARCFTRSLSLCAFCLWRGCSHWMLQLSVAGSEFPPSAAQEKPCTAASIHPPAGSSVPSLCGNKAKEWHPFF